MQHDVPYKISDEKVIWNLSGEIKKIFLCKFNGFQRIIDWTYENKGEKAENENPLAIE